MKKNEKEKRKYQRFPLPVAHYQGRDDKGIRGVSDVWDVSREGFRILSSAPIKKGAVLEFKINVPEVLEIQCQGQVCWSGSTQGGYWEGLHFLKIDPIEKEELLEYAYKVWLKNEGVEKIESGT